MIALCLFYWLANLICKIRIESYCLVFIQDTLDCCRVTYIGCDKFISEWLDYFFIYVECIRIQYQLINVDNISLWPDSKNIIHEIGTDKTATASDQHASRYISRHQQILQMNILGQNCSTTKCFPKGPLVQCIRIDSIFGLLTVISKFDKWIRNTWYNGLTRSLNKPNFRWFLKNIQNRMRVQSKNEVMWFALQRLMLH